MTQPRVIFSFDITLILLKCLFISAPEDFVSAIVPVVFAPDFLNSRSLCGNITIIFDEIVEDSEEFLVVINSSDPGVQITQPSAPVFIMDNSSKYSPPRMSF